MSNKKSVKIISVHPDMQDSRVPAAMFWTCQQVADWLAKNGHERYVDCFLTNSIDGRRLVHVDASHLTKIGVNDWLHIKSITKLVRDLMNIEDPDWSRSISLPPKESTSMYLEVKSHVGHEADCISYEEFERATLGKVWQPPLGNVGVIASTACRDKPQLHAPASAAINDCR